MTDKERLVASIMKEAEEDGEPVTKEEAEEMADMEIKAKGIKRYEQSEKPRKKVTKERKIDPDKLELIKVLAETFEDYEGLSVKNEAEVSFKYHGGEYTVKLIKHRPPKASKGGG